MRNLSILICTSMLLVACETSPESDPAYISPTHYSNYNCNQISAEMQRVSAKLEQARQTDMAGQVLSAAVSAFAISQGHSVRGGGNDDVMLRRLQNQYDVLEQTAIQKECSTNI